MNRTISISNTTAPVNLGTTCQYQAFKNPQSPAAITLITTPAICGYNQNSSAYCPSATGDAFVSAFYSQLQKVLSAGVNCHVNSDSIWWGLDCADFMSKLGSGVYYSFMWKYYYLNATSGFLNTPYIMNNTNCVRSQVSELFWQGQVGPTPSYSLILQVGFISGLIALLNLF